MQSLKYGLVLIDTPGNINSVTDLHIPLRYSDMILYCINAICPFSDNDRMMVDDLKAAGLVNNLFCLSTMMDIIDFETGELQEFYRYFKQKCSNIGFTHPPFYLNSILARKARVENSDKKYALSGFGELMKEIDLQMEAKQNRFNCERLI